MCWRRASSADLGKPLWSLHPTSGERPDETQQRDETIGVVTGEAFDERGRQPGRIDRRHERGASDLPEWCRGEALTPPCAPALDGAAIDADHLGQLPQARRRCAVPQDRDQHHDRGNVDLTAQEAQRRRRRPRPAAVERAAEAQAPVVLAPEAAGPATRLAPIMSAMNNAAASLAPSTPSGVGEVAITGEQQLVECGVGQHVSVQRMRPPGSKVLTTMAKPGRNDPCPCGSGNKYKKCCLANEEAVAREQLAKAEARRAERTAETAAAHRLHLREVKAAIAASLSGAADADEDELTIASNAAAELVRAGKLDEAEQAARDLLVLFPDVHDGYDRLGMVYEARGDKQKAADCYRNVIAFIKEHPDDYGPGFEDVFVKLVDRLDPPTET